MANRFNSKGKTKYSQQPLSMGYSDGSKSDFVIPSFGIEDIDSAIFNFFNDELPLQVGNSDGSNLKKIPVLFAGGEKWAQLKKNKPLRDKNNSLILPLLTISRASINQASSEDIVGRGINQKTGEIVIKRRLSREDRDYQKIVNRLNLKNQQNLALNNRDDSGLMTLSGVGDMSENLDVVDGALLHPDKKNNIFEVIAVPSPQFISMMYEVTIWTQYTHHMNQAIEILMSSYLPQMQGWKIETPKGYWFLAEVEEGSMSPETNFDDLSQGERLIKHKFNIKAQAYIFSSNAPGVPIPVKRYLSMPRISFEMGIPKNSESISDPTNPNIVDNPFLGADDPTLPYDSGRIRRTDARDTDVDILNPIHANATDPALNNYPRGRKVEKYAKVTSKGINGQETTKHVKVLNINKFTGETTYLSGIDLSNLNNIEIEK
jgi:hypothetical protein